MAAPLIARAHFAHPYFAHPYIDALPVRSALAAAFEAPVARARPALSP